jgi:hypothetical protein
MDATMMEEETKKEEEAVPPAEPMKRAEAPETKPEEAPMPEEKADEEGKQPAREKEEKAGEPEEAKEEAAPEEKKAAEQEPELEEKEPEEPKEEEKKRKAAPEAPGSPTSGKRERRERKSLEVYQPEDFVNVDRSTEIPEGRGTKLGDLKSVRESIDKYTLSAPEMAMAHRLLFKGKPPKKEMKSNILEFSGYLKKEEKDLDEEEQTKKDEEAEVSLVRTADFCVVSHIENPPFSARFAFCILQAKMGQKAYKLKIPQLKQLCDFFAIDRSHKKDKDSLVDVLLDFLAAPSDDLLKKRKRGRPSRKDKKEEKQEYDDVVDEDEDQEDEKPPKKAKGRMPSDAELRKWVRAYVRCHNMETSTIKEAISIASEKFGVDVSEKKSRMKEMLTEEV